MFCRANFSRYPPGVIDHNMLVAFQHHVIECSKKEEGMIIRCDICGIQYHITKIGRHMAEEHLDEVRKVRQHEGQYSAPWMEQKMVNSPEKHWTYYYDDFVRKCVSLIKERGEEYNRGDVDMPDYFDGPQDFFMMIRLKFLRLKSGLPKMNTTQMLDTLYDLVNYAAFFGTFLMRVQEEEKKLAPQTFAEQVEATLGPLYQKPTSTATFTEVKNDENS